jgi:hypothetical protein
VKLIADTAAIAISLVLLGRDGYYAHHQTKVVGQIAYLSSPEQPDGQFAGSLAPHNGQAPQPWCA